MREKVLAKFCKLLRIVNDDRTPEGERDAARARLDALVERWQFTDIEVARQIRAEADAEEGERAKALRAQRERQRQMQQQAAAWAEWSGNSIVFGSNNFKAETIIFRFR